MRLPGISLFVIVRFYNYFCAVIIISYRSRKSALEDVDNDSYSMRDFRVYNHANRQGDKEARTVEMAFVHPAIHRIFHYFICSLRHSGSAGLQHREIARGRA